MASEGVCRSSLRDEPPLPAVPGVPPPLPGAAPALPRLRERTGVTSTLSKMDALSTAAAGLPPAAMLPLLPAKRRRSPPLLFLLPPSGVPWPLEAPSRTEPNAVTEPVVARRAWVRVVSSGLDEGRNSSSATRQGPPSVRYMQQFAPSLP